MERINVTKTFLPPIDEYNQFVEDIWRSGQLTNGGRYVHELEEKLVNYLEVSRLQYVANGTIALQLSIEALGYKDGEIITTPFSYVATTSAILWEKFTPVYVDIEPDTFCIDPDKIESAITDKTRAILAVHVFGNPCNVDIIATIAKKHNLKVIYDAAHAFGVKYQGKSIFDYGDVSTCSFHATKLFHTVEGGAIIANDAKIDEKIELMKRFGHNGDDHYLLGINAKASELHAAMGLVNINHIEQIMSSRRQKSKLYEELLRPNKMIVLQKIRPDTEYNYAYFPVVFESEAKTLEVIEALNAINVYPRRYFYPSLNTLDYVSAEYCPVSESLATRILCLPLYADLGDEVVRTICERITR